MGSEGIKTVDTQTQRIEDKANLEEKVQHVEDFIKSEAHEALPDEEKKRLAIQLHHMKGYLSTLGERIASVI